MSKAVLGVRIIRESTLKRCDNDYRLQMIVILMCKIDGVFVFMGFCNTAGNAGQVVCPFIEVSIIQIVFLLEEVLLYTSETKKSARTGQAAVSPMA